MTLTLIPAAEFARVRQAPIDPDARLALLADMCRANTLAVVKRAGSGHLGSSLSSLDIVTSLYFEGMNTAHLAAGHPDRDIYFSSKGHDAPGLYAVLFALGILPAERFTRLRRLEGTPGHPDVRVEGIEACTGSLGMGVSKGKGFALAKQLRSAGGRIYVMTGDGELQEGQIYEALLSAANQRLSNLTAIVDHNKVQSDRLVDTIGALGDLAAKGRAFGWHVVRCDGHDFAALRAAFAECRNVIDRPQLVIADTIKGKGVSFMEHPAALAAGGGCYKWHAGAPDDEAFAAAYAEVMSRVAASLDALGLVPLAVQEMTPEEPRARIASPESVGAAYGQALAAAARRHPSLVVLDADLAADCHLREMEAAYPERFVENGIAEQDMVSMAGGFALSGFLPVVNTFAAFLARANEQAYNNGCEGTRTIYGAHYAGVLPGEPGASHQSIRDIALFGTLPNVTIVQPANAVETRMAVDYAIERAVENVVIRLFMGRSPGPIALPADYHLTPGRGVTLADGSDAVLFAYGPVMLHEALSARARLASEGVGVAVVNMPWLNRIDSGWLAEIVRGRRHLFVVEDHGPSGGLGDCLLKRLHALGLLEGRTFQTFAVEGYPACGTREQVLSFHGLDAASLARRIAETTIPASGVIVRRAT